MDRKRYPNDRYVVVVRYTNETLTFHKFTKRITRDRFAAHLIDNGYTVITKDCTMKGFITLKVKP